MMNASQIMAQLSKSDEASAHDKKQGSSVEATSAAGAFYQLFSGKLSETLAKDGFRAEKTANIEAAAPQKESNLRKEVKEERSLLRDDSKHEKPARTRENDSVRNNNERETRTNRSEISKSPDRTEQVKENSNNTKEIDKTGDEKVTKDTKADERKAARIANRLAVKAARGGLSLNENALKTVQASKADTAGKIQNFATDSIKQASSQANPAKQVKTASSPATASKNVAETGLAAEKNDIIKTAAPKQSQVQQTQRQTAPEQARESQNNASQNEQQSQGKGESLNAADRTTADQAATKSAQQGNRSFNEAFNNAKSSAMRSESAAAAPKTGPQVTQNVAAVQYNRVGSEVLNASKVKAPVKTMPSQIINQVIKAAKISINGGKEEIKLLLKPQELGWLKVKISIEGQRVTAHIGAENEHVRSLIENNLSQLQHALQGQNMKVSQILVDVNTQQGNNLANSKENSQGRGNGSANKSTEYDENIADELMMPLEMAVMELSAVDVRV